MPASKKQSERRGSQKSKVDDEPAAAAASNGMLAAVKGLALGSVLVEVLPMVPLLMKDAGVAPAKKEETKEEKKEEENDENKENTDGAATNGEASKSEEKPKDAGSVFESLTSRLAVVNSLGLDKSPDVAWAMFTRLEVDWGPRARKGKSLATERIMLNLERNLSQYINIAMLLMVLNTLVFRSYFACLPWLVFYQLLSLHLPMDAVREAVPQVPEVPVKFRVAATMAIHALVWAFFLLELLYQTYFLAKIPLIGLFVVHALVVRPEDNLEAARKEVAENKAKEATEAKPATPGAASASTVVAMVRLILGTSFLAKLGPMAPDLIKQLKAGAAKKADKKSDEGEQKEGEDTAKATGSESAFEPLLGITSIYNALGLGAQQASMESWRQFTKLEIDMGPKSKKASAADRIMANFETNMGKYLHIFLALMCLRSFLFRSWFACLPWLLFYQMLCVNIPALSAKIPQLAAVQVTHRVAATGVFNALLWLFFAYEAFVMTHFMEKVLFAGIFIAHAYVVSPVPN